MPTRSQIPIELQPSAQSSSQNENFVNTSKKLFKNWNWTFLVVRYFTLTLKFVSYILVSIIHRIYQFESLSRQVASKSLEIDSNLKKQFFSSKKYINR